jgi:hypothetical protein
MVDFISTVALRFGVSMFVVCIICGCEQKQPEPQKETPQSQVEESADAPR